MVALNQFNAVAMIVVDNLAGGRSHVDHIDVNKHYALTVEIVDLI